MKRDQARALFQQAQKTVFDDICQRVVIHAQKTLSARS